MAAENPHFPRLPAPARAEPLSSGAQPRPPAPEYTKYTCGKLCKVYYLVNKLIPFRAKSNPDPLPFCNEEFTLLEQTDTPKVLGEIVHVRLKRFDRMTQCIRHRSVHPDGLRNARNGASFKQISRRCKPIGRSTP